MLEDIPRNVWRHSPEYNIPHSLHSVPGSCIPGFIHSRCIDNNFQNILRTNSLDNGTGRDTFDSYSILMIDIWLKLQMEIVA